MKLKMEEPLLQKNNVQTKLLNLSLQRQNLSRYCWKFFGSYVQFVPLTCMWDNFGYWLLLTMPIITVHKSRNLLWIFADAEEAITVDDFLPALIFLVIKSDIPNW